LPLAPGFDAAEDLLRLLGLLGVLRGLQLLPQLVEDGLELLRLLQPLHGLRSGPFVFAESLTQVLNLHNGPPALSSIEILPVEIR
jgi:hypothetical protein